MITSGLQNLPAACQAGQPAPWATPGGTVLWPPPAPSTCSDPLGWVPLGLGCEICKLPWRQQSLCQSSVVVRGPAQLCPVFVNSERQEGRRSIPSLDEEIQSSQIQGLAQGPAAEEWSGWDLNLDLQNSQAWSFHSEPGQD